MVGIDRFETSASKTQGGPFPGSAARFLEIPNASRKQNNNFNKERWVIVWCIDFLKKYFESISCRNQSDSHSCKAFFDDIGGFFKQAFPVCISGRVTEFLKNLSEA